MEIYVILHQMVQLFIMMGLGYLLYKVKIIDAGFNKKMTRFVLDFTLPLMVLASVLEQPADRDYGVVAEMIVISDRSAGYVYDDADIRKCRLHGFSCT